MKTGTPRYTGKYLITDKYGNIDVDHWYNTDDAYKEITFNNLLELWIQFLELLQV